jgi:hypothetical protein
MSHSNAHTTVVSFSRSSFFRLFFADPFKPRHSGLRLFPTIMLIRLDEPSIVLLRQNFRVQETTMCNTIPLRNCWSQEPIIPDCHFCTHPDGAGSCIQESEACKSSCFRGAGDSDRYRTSSQQAQMSDPRQRDLADFLEGGRTVRRFPASNESGARVWHEDRMQQSAWFVPGAGCWPRVLSADPKACQ